LSIYHTAVRRAALFVGRTGAGQTFTVVDRIVEIDPVLWATIFPAHWKDYRYYQTLEETFADEFPQRYLVLESEHPGGGIAAIQPFFFAAQDLTVSLPARWRAMLRPLRRWLKPRILMVGCIVGEAQTGVGETEELPKVCAALAEALEQYARYEGAGIILCKDFPAPYRPAMRELVSRGRYTRLASLPAVGLKLDFDSVEQYVETRLGKATRKNLRRKFRDVERTEPITLEVRTAVTDDEARIVHALYERVARRGDVHFEVFSKEYFLRLSERMPEQTRYFIWRQSGRVIAFSFCTVHAGAIYDNDLGLDDRLASRLHLYHVTFRDIIKWALAHGLTHYYSSPFNYDPKWHLRMHLVPLDLYARHRHGLVNAILRLVAPWAAPTRQEPLLKHFPNAHELE
jgi:hypothetical protein